MANPNFQSMTKKELETWARENLGIELDRRLAKSKLIEQIEHTHPADLELPTTEPVVVEKVVEVEKIVEVHVGDSGETGKALKDIVDAYEMWIGRNRDRNSYRALAESIIHAKTLI